MADALTTVTQFINSPPGQLAAGGVLAGIVWKFFERVEAVLTDDAKLEIAVWLLDVKVEPNVEPWSSTFLNMFNRVFGEVHPSMNGFHRYYRVTMTGVLLQAIFRFPRIPLREHFWLPSLATSMRLIVPLILVGFAIAAVVLIVGYLALCCVQWTVARASSRTKGSVLAIWSVTALSILTGIALVLFLAVSAFTAIHYLTPTLPPDVRNSLPPSTLAYIQTHQTYLQSVSGLRLYDWFLYLLEMLPLFLGTLWLDLYAGSGFILRAARRFDIGFAWFNRRFKIEEKPLQSIGLVAGSLVAVVYWSAAIVSRVVR